MTIINLIKLKLNKLILGKQTVCMCHICISVPITIKTWLQNVCFKIAVTKCKKGISMCYMDSNTTGQGKPHLYLIHIHVSFSSPV